MGNNQSQHHAGDGARSGPGGRVVSGLRSRSSTVNSLASRVTPSSSHGGTGSGGSPSAETAAPDAGDLPIADPKKQVDHGWLDPENHLYRSEYNRGIVHRLIADRKLAPFYLGLQDFEDEWQVDAIVEALDEAEQQATQNLRDAHAAAVEAAHEREAAQISAPTGTRKHKDAIAAYNLSVLHRERLAQMVKQREKRGGGALQKTDKAEHARFYQGNALECPICFLYYPSNMVHTRCCDQPICTECFVSIKRADPTPTHLESEPAACPFCMETNFGCIYPHGARPPIAPTASGVSGSSGDSAPSPVSPSDESRPRRKSFAHTDQEVVTTDMIHPDWEAKLEQMKAVVARRANRRIVFRQVGDRLIPVGITSGRGGEGATPTMAGTQGLPPQLLSQIAAALDASNENGGSSSGSRRRSRSSRRRSNDEMAQLLESLGLGGGADIEEMMLQEAMRISQLEEEERQRKTQAEQSAQEEAAAKAQAAQPTSSPTQVEQDPATAQMLSEAISGTLSDSAPASAPVHETSVSHVAVATTAAPQVNAPLPQANLDLPSTPTDRATNGTAAEPAAVVEVTEAAVVRPAAPQATASFASDASGITATSVSPSQGYLQLPEDGESEAHDQPKHAAGQHVEIGATQPLVNL
ncbi:hypothetical protein JCM8202_006082 [Rhodotorula sphaerocarpa]